MEHLKLLRHLEEIGCTLETKDDGVLMVNGNTRGIGEATKQDIKRLKSQLIEALRDREMLYETIGWDVDHAQDHEQLGLFMDETQREYEKGTLRREHAEHLAARAHRRSKKVPMGPTGYKAVLWTHEGLAARNGVSPEQLSSIHWGNPNRGRRKQ